MAEASLSESVSSNYVVMRNVMRNLSWRDLYAAQAMCKLWFDVANDLRRLELHAQHFCVASAGRLPNFKFLTSPESLVRPEIVLAFLVPKLVYYPLACSRFPYRRRETGCREECPAHKILEHLHIKFCHPETSVIGISSNKIFYSQPARRKPILGEPMSSGIAIPKIPGVTVRILKISKDEYLSDNKVCSELNKIMETQLIKCLLIFLTEKRCTSQESFVEKMISDIDSRQKNLYPNNQFAAGGCVIKSAVGIDFDKLDRTGENMSIIVFSVNASESNRIDFDAYSTVFSLYSRSKEKMIQSYKNKLKEMSDLIPMRKYSTCIKLSCFKRKSIFDCEAALFSKQFPDTPIVGCDAMGEIGIECLPSPLSDEPPDKRPRKSETLDCVHAYSTIVVILTWGHL